MSSTPSSPVVSEPEQPSPRRRYLALLGCNAMVFIASVCIMALELTAARLIAKNVGSSLYTWTSVIGIVLAGITIGNYIGGWLSDRVQTRRLLAWLFFLASVSCFAVLWLDQLLIDYQRPGSMSWPLWVVAIVASMFLLPSTLMGAISPAVANLALTVHLRTGITLGNVYAWGALGSIVGTFLTGFVLIDVLGSRAIVTLIALVLALVGTLVAARQRVFRTAVVLGWIQFVILFGLAASVSGAKLATAANLVLGPGTSASSESDDHWITREITLHAVKKIGHALHDLGLALYLRDDFADEYHDESNYSTIIVGEESWENTQEMVRFLRIDKLVHSYYNPDQPDRLYDYYERIYAEATETCVAQWRAAGIAAEKDGKPLVNGFFVGGGGYVFPRWMERRYASGSIIEVAEIDPAVTDAVRKELGLPAADETTIISITGDARNVLDDRLRTNGLAAASGQIPVLYDVVYGDAFNDFSVPWHLVTLEFTRKVKNSLKPHGVYMVNLIDRYPRTEYRATDIQLPAQLSPPVPGEDWQSAPAPFEAIEIKREQETLWLAVRGSMPDELRDRLLELAPEQAEYARAIQDLATRSRAEKSGRFLGRFLNTVRAVFPNLYVYSTDGYLPSAQRDTFVIVASPAPVPALRDGVRSGFWRGAPFAVLESNKRNSEMDSRMSTLLAQSEGLLLTDDFAPVDNLLLPVVATQN